MKMENKFRPGDKVRVTNRPALSLAAAQYYGQEFVVIKVDENVTWYSGDKGAYSLEGIDKLISWNEKWLELVEPVKNINVSENDIDSLFGE